MGEISANIRPIVFATIPPKKEKQVTLKITAITMSKRATYHKGEVVVFSKTKNGIPKKNGGFYRFPDRTAKIIYFSGQEKI